MIFKQVDEIISGAKTQTRRVVKPGELLEREYHGTYQRNLVRTNAGRVKWMVGKDYAVVSKRGTRGVMWRPDTRDWYVPVSAEDVREGYEPLRIEITSIRREALQAIDERDATSEGVINRFNAFNIYEPSYYVVRCVDGEYDVPSEAYRALWDSINNSAGVRWRDV